MSTVILYHRLDLDGLACGLLLQDHYKKENPVMIGYDYADTFPDIFQGEDLVIADLNFEPDKLREWASVFNFIYLIDHHQKTSETVQNNLLTDVDNLYIYVDTQKAGCELVYDFIKGKYILDYPYWIQQIARWDIHRDENGSYWDSCKEYQFGLKHCNTIEDLRKGLLVGAKKIISNGKIILRYKEGMNKKNSFILDKKEMIVPADKGADHYLVSVSTTPMDPKDLPKDVHFHLYIQFQVPAYAFKVTMISDGNIDVAKVASRFGGGGHVKVAGFMTKNLNFLI